MARVLSEGSQINDYWEGERENREWQETKRRSKEEVAKETFQKGLYCLGKTTNAVSFAYLAMNIADQDLFSLAGI